MTENGKDGTNIRCPSYGGVRLIEVSVKRELTVCLFPNAFLDVNCKKVGKNLSLLSADRIQFSSLQSTIVKLPPNRAKMLGQYLPNNKEISLPSKPASSFFQGSCSGL